MHAWRFALRGAVRGAKAHMTIGAATSAAPVKNVAGAPKRSHSDPAMTLDSRIATPLRRLNTPKAVPRSVSGAVSATIVARTPCVKPICRPHSAAPPKTVAADASMPSNTSAERSSTSPMASGTRRSSTSESLPTG